MLTEPYGITLWYLKGEGGRLSFPTDGTPAYRLSVGDEQGSDLNQDSSYRVLSQRLCPVTRSVMRSSSRSGSAV